MTATEAIELLESLQPQTAIPIHYEGWRHFRQGRDEVEAEFAKGAGGAPRDRVRWLPLGVAAEIGV